MSLCRSRSRPRTVRGLQAVLKEGRMPRAGSRAGGSCAASGNDYITREGEYDDPDRDPATY
jgi:hypothetical protein